MSNERKQTSMKEAAGAASRQTAAASYWSQVIAAGHSSRQGDAPTAKVAPADTGEDQAKRASRARLSAA